MSTKKSTLITNAEAEPNVLNAGALEGGIVRTKTDTIELATGDLATSDTVELLDLPSNAVIHSIVLFNDDLDSDGSPTLVADVGLYTVDENDAIVAADVDTYATAITDLQSANTAGVEVRFEARNIDEIANRVFEDAGLTVDPGGIFRLALTLTTGAATAAAGTLSFFVEYKVEA